MAKKNGKTVVQIPLHFGAPVATSAESTGALSATITVNGGTGLAILTQADDATFAEVSNAGDGGATPAAASFRVNNPAAVVPGTYQTMKVTFESPPLPEQGLIEADQGGYLSYRFNPPSAEGAFMPRDIVFVIDISGSMDSNNR